MIPNNAQNTQQKLGVMFSYLERNYISSLKKRLAFFLENFPFHLPDQLALLLARLAHLLKSEEKRDCSQFDRDQDPSLN